MDNRNLEEETELGPLITIHFEVPRLQAEHKQQQDKLRRAKRKELQMQRSRRNRRLKQPSQQ